MRDKEREEEIIKLREEVKSLKMKNKKLEDIINKVHNILTTSQILLYNFILKKNNTNLYKTF